MTVAVRQKDPAETLDYTLNWETWGLGSNTISASAWVVPSGLTQVAASFGNTTATIRLSGGTNGQDYEIVNTVTLSNGQIAERSFMLQVRQEEAGSTSDATDRSRAVSTLLSLVSIDAAPAITQTELEQILDRHKVASTWASATAYCLGQRLLPAVRNGYWYLVVQPGTSRSNAKTYFEWPQRYGLQFAEGSSDPVLILEAQGDDSIFRVFFNDPTSVNVYDVNAAAREAWMLKARKASEFMDGNGLSFSQVHDHCLQMAKSFQPIHWPIDLVRG